MNIILVSSEVVPFAKTGGLADVCGALPQELENLGHDVTVFMPGFRQCFQAESEHPEIEIEKPDITFSVPLGTKLVDGEFFMSTIPGSTVTIYFVGNDNFFGRDKLYGEDGSDYADNSQRFVFFCRAVIESIRLLELSPDLLHCNDWQAGLLPALLKLECEQNEQYANIATLMTVHNLAYQGSFWHWDMLLTGIDWKHFTWQEMEHHGRLNLLKTGLVFADAINTVSPTYAREIQTPEQGCGLEGVLEHRSDVLSGILNGIDTQTWNPSTDRLIVRKYDASNFEKGKAVCKQALQLVSGLKPDENIPLIGIVGRLAEQKGWSLILSTMKRWLESGPASSSQPDMRSHANTQWVVLGTGDPSYEASLRALQRSFPGRIGLTLGFSNELAHQIESGADIFLMPSEYEPCGLNQMYSMAYGTVPVVRETGGLADTVVDATPEAIASGSANGFSFSSFSAQSLELTLARARAMYVEDRETWNGLVKNGMTHDWSWSAGARRYEQLYASTIERHRKNRESQQTA